MADHVHPGSNVSKAYATWRGHAWEAMRYIKLKKAIEQEAKEWWAGMMITEDKPTVRATPYLRLHLGTGVFRIPPAYVLVLLWKPPPAYWYLHYAEILALGLCAHRMLHVRSSVFLTWHEMQESSVFTASRGGAETRVVRAPAGHGQTSQHRRLQDPTVQVRPDATLRLDYLALVCR